MSMIEVIDFGVAKALHQRLTERTMFTEFGPLIGTLEYMSPEQAELSALDIDTRADIYSLGVLLYELLTSTTPLPRQRRRAGPRHRASPRRRTRRSLPAEPRLPPQKIHPQTAAELAEQKATAAADRADRNARRADDEAMLARRNLNVSHTNLASGMGECSRGQGPGIVEAARATTGQRRPAWLRVALLESPGPFLPVEP